MENRWQFSFSSEQINKLIYVTWVNDGREIPEPLKEENRAVFDSVALILKATLDSLTNESK